MTEIDHRQFPDFLNRSSDPPPVVYLIYGETALIDQCIGPLTQFLLQGASREMHLESTEGLVENIPDVVSQLNTFSFLSGPKIVVFKDAKFFDTQHDQQRLLDQIQEAYGADRMEAAAKAYLSLCRRIGLGLNDLASASRLHPDLQPLQAAIGEDAIRALTALCGDKGWTVDSSVDPLQTLILALEKGFPDHHYLIITSTGKVPKNRKLYKIIAGQGWVVDCSVPLGDKKADKTVQETVLRQTLERMLTAGGKKMAPALFAKLTALTGFDLPVFIQNLEKLVAYVGDRKEITANDIDALLRRTKNDPVYEFTNAVAERDAGRAIALMQGLLKANWHALQILSALANQIRKLLVAKDFVASDLGRSWSPAMPYTQFQNAVMPAIKEFDTRISERLAAWQSDSSVDGPSIKKKGTKKSTFALALSAGGSSAYPIYLTLVKSEKFSVQELVHALTLLSQTDIRLKSTGQDPAVMLTALLLSICRS